MKNWLVLGLLIITSTLLAQINPGVDDIYRPNELATLSLSLSPEDFTFLLDPANVGSDVYLEAIFQMKNSQMDTTLSAKVGIRLRGNTSRNHPKKPFKIKFTEFNGEKFFGYKKFNLKPNNNDPSQIREPLTLQFYRAMSVPAARTHPLKLYINDEYMGVYTNVEQIDDEFIDKRFGHEDGFLYKCGYGATLEDNGQVFNVEMFESEMNSTIDTRSEIDHFVDVLNNTPESTFETAIQSVFNVDRYLRQLAVEAMLGHWDAYSYNKNNFYLYYNASTTQVEFIPYDTDNTWGIDWVNQDWGTRDLNNWANTEQPRPLTNRILNTPSFRRKYEAYLHELLELYFTEAYVMPLTENYKNLLDVAILEDSYFVTTFGFSHADFLNSFTNGISGTHVKYGIQEFLVARSQSAAEQLAEVVTALDTKEHLRRGIFPNPSNEPQLYYQNFSGAPENTIVYSATGIKIPVTYSTINSTLKISLPENTPHGIYMIMMGGEAFRWVYR